MKKIFTPKHLLIYLIVFLAIFIPSLGLANGGACDPGPILPKCTCTGNCGLNDFVVLIANLYKWAVGLVAVVAVFFLIMAGWTLLTAAGNQDKITEGKKSVTTTIVGLLLVLGSWVFTSTIVFFLTGDPKTEIFGVPWWRITNACPLEGQECLDTSQMDEEEKYSRSCSGSCGIGSATQYQCCDEDFMACCFLSAQEPCVDTTAGMGFKCPSEEYTLFKLPCSEVELCGLYSGESGCCQNPSGECKILEETECTLGGGNFLGNLPCDNYSDCTKQGCCIVGSAPDGCYEGLTQSECGSLNGAFVEYSSCLEISDCRGCCTVTPCVYCYESVANECYEGVWEHIGGGGVCVTEPVNPPCCPYQ